MKGAISKMTQTKDTSLRELLHSQAIRVVLLSAVMIFGQTGSLVNLPLHLKAYAQEDTYCDPSITSCTPTDVLVDADGNVICNPHEEDCSSYLTAPETPPAETPPAECDPNTQSCPPTDESQTPPAECDPNTQSCPPTDESQTPP